jgi:hypothetical protein
MNSILTKPLLPETTPFSAAQNTATLVAAKGWAEIAVQAKWKTG